MTDSSARPAPRHVRLQWFWLALILRVKAAALKQTWPLTGESPAIFDGCPPTTPPITMDHDGSRWMGIKTICPRYRMDASFYAKLPDMDSGFSGCCFAGRCRCNSTAICCCGFFFLGECTEFDVEIGIGGKWDFVMCSMQNTRVCFSLPRCQFGTACGLTTRGDGYQPPDVDRFRSLFTPGLVIALFPPI